MERCNWPNLEHTEIYQDYHDNQWGVATYDDGLLFEMFVLESFHCGLSWLLILKKRENFRKAFDQFDAEKIAAYDEAKVDELMQDTGIVRNRGKILATITNAKAYLKVVAEFGSFSDYLWDFTDHKVVYHPFDGVTTRSELSDKVAKDLKKRGFKFMGTVTCHSYLEAIGIQNNHATNCYKFVKPAERV
ncbi:MAG: DNA-3-methyladenine glycosylase I [Eubacteriales bacterium]